MRARIYIYSTNIACNKKLKLRALLDVQVNRKGIHLNHLIQ